MARPKRFELLTPRFVVWWPGPLRPRPYTYRDQSRIRLSRSVPSWPHLAGRDQGLDGVNGDNDPAAPVVTRHGRQARVRKLSSPDQIANVIRTAADNGGCLFDAERQALGKIELLCDGAHRGALPA